MLTLQNIMSIHELNIHRCHISNTEEHTHYCVQLMTIHKSTELYMSNVCENVLKYIMYIKRCIYTFGLLTCLLTIADIMIERAPQILQHVSVVCLLKHLLSTTAVTTNTHKRFHDCPIQTYAYLRQEITILIVAMTSLLDHCDQRYYMNV